MSIRSTIAALTVASLLTPGMAYADSRPQAAGEAVLEAEDEEDEAEAEDGNSDEDEAEGWHDEPEEKPPIKRFSLSGGGALNVIMPAVQTQVGFRLPVGDDDLELLFGYGPINNAFFFSNDPPLIHPTIALRSYVIDDPFFQLFTGLTTGYLFQSGVNSVTKLAVNSGTPTVMLGGGLTIMPWDHLGFTVGLDVGYPFIVRPSLDVRLAF
jgi:hypothetical protein